MMEAYATEEQQFEAIKNWFNKHGNVLSWIIIIILGIALGIKYWFHHQEVLAQQASDIYETLLTGRENQDNITVTNQANRLMKDYPHLVYASLARMVLAFEAVKQQRYEEAEQQLTWVMKQKKGEELTGLARIRLMRLFISQDKLPQALALYDEKQTKMYLPILLELKGDILLKQQNLKGAREAYEKALEHAPKEGMMGIFLKIKLEELGNVR